MRDITLTFYPDDTFVLENAIDEPVTMRIGDTLTLHLEQTDKVGRVIVDTSRLRPDPIEEPS